MLRRDFLTLLAASPLLVRASDAMPAVDFPAVVEGRPIVFPRDHGAHPAYRTEWWYVTGWLELEGGGTIGFQSTFFRVRTGIGEDSESAFAPRQLVLAHAAISEPRFGRLRHDERAARTGFNRAGFSSDGANVFIGNWRFAENADGYDVTVGSAAFAYSLRLARTAPPLLNGVAGFSQKGPDRRDASYYYSEPQLAVSGSVTIEGRAHRASGRAWLDHEWASEILPAAARGWDWIGVNLSDGGALLAFRLRSASGPLWAGATLRSAGGGVVAEPPPRVAFEPLRNWQSPRTAILYPVEWQIRVGARRFTVKPLFDDQELDSRRSTGAIYWEGAMRLFEDAREVGRGYLEMTGYGDRLRIG